MAKLDVISWIYCPSFFFILKRLCHMSRDIIILQDGLQGLVYTIRIFTKI